ncbi:MAG: 2-succinyl-5-enolpyruvyl-6-hydroxy-3-cyclohexene-1-carboxylic-acid synthase [Verrucomicrobiota bacterium]
MTTLDFRNTNALWGSVLVETLVRSGVGQAVISPGSRSTPLTMALAENPRIEAIPVLDERSAAFFALGLARQSGKPAVLVCTSGSAGANYLPAVVEAHESGTPMIVITADRPPEMRECASGQTIDQQKLFGGFADWYHELAVPAAEMGLLGYLRQTIAHAVGQALAGGVVHLNAPFRDPLPPVEDGTSKGLVGQIDEGFFAHLGDAATVESGQVVVPCESARGVIVVGPTGWHDPVATAATISRLAKATGWPVLADSLSPLREFAINGESVVTAYDAILRNEQVAAALAPEQVLCLGGWPISKVLRGWLEKHQPSITLVSPRGVNLDALHGRTRLVVAPLAAVNAISGVAGGAYREAWSRAERAARMTLAEALDRAASGAFEGRAVWTLAQALPAGSALCVANSMPVRDLEYFWPLTGGGRRIHFSRGANGIDGTLSTALGVAHGGRPTVLLTGDLALLHDTNGFLARPELRGSLTIVLINNAGGGIFGHLPVSTFSGPFERFWATPQAVDFGKLCSAYGVEHVAVRDWEHLRELTTTLPESGLRVLEVRTERKADVVTRRALFAAAAKASGAACAQS